MTLSFKVVSDKESWRKVLGNFETYDFYHTYDYHQLSKKEEENQVLVHYDNNGHEIAFPLLIRPITGTTYFDAVSVYGYPGPLTKNTGTADYDAFKKELISYFSSENIISVFSRLNPYISNQTEVLNNFGTLTLKGQVVNIDIGKTVEESRAAYSKSTKSRVNKAKKKCYVKSVTSDEDINAFIDIYYENMERLNAQKSYFFPRQYFFDFFGCTDFSTEILMVFDIETDIPIAASMFVKTNNIVQFHLSGTRNDYLDIAPARVFLDEMRIKSTEEGFSYFNLGGGLGGEKDSLFEFKSSFSKDFKDFYIWSLITNQEAYHSLCAQNIDLSENAERQISFFPLYRYKK